MLREAVKVARDINMLGAIQAITWLGLRIPVKTEHILLGQKASNELGIYDMSGNVYEWVSGWFVGDYNSSAQLKSKVHDSAFRVIRGGSWDDYARDELVSHRCGNAPDGRFAFLGFRLARDANKVKPD